MELLIRKLDTNTNSSCKAWQVKGEQECYVFVWNLSKFKVYLLKAN